VNFLNEPKALWHAIYPKEDLIGSYSRGPAQYRLGAENVTPEMLRAAQRLYGYCLALTGSQRIVDKYPEMIFRIPFLLALFPNAKLIFLVRNGWDVARSVTAWSQRAGGQVGSEMHDWWGVEQRKWHLLVRDVVDHDPLFANALEEIAAFTRHEDMAAVEWIAAMQEGLRLMQSMPDRIHQVRFEALTSRPERTLKDLLAFCELPGDSLLLSYAQRVLVPIPTKQPIALPQVIETPFTETMKALGYAIEGP
jgi:hypothetical protein